MYGKLVLIDFVIFLWIPTSLAQSFNASAEEKAVCQRFINSRPACGEGCRNGAVNCPQGWYCCFHDCGSKCINPQQSAGVQFDRYYPSFGPVAGGTQIKVWGNFTSVQRVLRAQLRTSSTGLKLEQLNTVYNCTARLMTNGSDQYIAILTPKVPKYAAEMKLSIYITYVHGLYQQISTKDTGFTFTYKSDPVIYGITPQQVFIRGGLPITAYGANLDSVASPLMNVYVELRNYNQQSNSYSLLKTVTFQSNNTYYYNRTTIVGISPEIDVARLSPVSGVSRRKKRQTFNTTNILNNNTLQVFVGFQLDGVQRFENLSQAIDAQAGKLTVVTNPMLFQFNNTKSFDPGAQPTIEMKGERLDLGASLKDYEVSVGDDKCEVLDLTSNTLVCQPPKEEPNPLQDIHFQEGKPHMKVTVGYIVFNIGHVDYVTDNTFSTAIYAVIGVLCGGAAIAMVVILVMFLRK